MVRPITRALLATAIEYAAQQKLSTMEWQRFFVNHYLDEFMETARRSVVEVIQSHEGRQLQPDAILELEAVAKALRERSD